ncbi:MAG: hypothetical protein JKY54_10800 [Flavobacteriales bacterium]|nr:hypothetical protein [Flavobacteriales bacterium]
MKTLALFIILITGSISYGQDSTDTSDIMVDVPNILKLHEPFLATSIQIDVSQWDHFQFYLFNRWGQIMAESTQPEFKVEDALKVKESELVKGVYVWKIEVNNDDGTKNEFIGHITYLGHTH